MKKIVGIFSSIQRIVGAVLAVGLVSANILCGMVSLREYSHSLPTQTATLHYGRVLSESKGASGYLWFRPSLTISINGIDEVVYAELAFDRPKNLPKVVSFYYDIGSGKEVYLEEESNPGYIFLFVLLANSMVLVGVIMRIMSVKRKQQRGMRNEDSRL